MATNESTRGGGIGSFFGGLFTLIGIVVLLGIGYAAWPKIKAAYYAQPGSPQATQQPTTDTSAIDAMKAQITRMQAELAAARAAQSVVIQSVPQGESPPAEPKVNIPVAPPAGGGESNGSVPPAPPPAPIVIVSHEGYQQPVITGSGACAAAKGARRCGK